MSKEGMDACATLALTGMVPPHLPHNELITLCALNAASGQVKKWDQSRQPWTGAPPPHLHHRPCRYN